MGDSDIVAASVAPEGDELNGDSNRRGRGVFGVILLLLLLLCAITTITETYVRNGGDQTIRRVTRNLECLQCHTELIPEFSKAAVHNPFMNERCTTCHTPHGEIRKLTVVEGASLAWNRTRTLVEWLPLKIVLDVFGTDEGGTADQETGGTVKRETSTEIKDQDSLLVLPLEELCWMCHGDMGHKLSWEYPHSPFERGHCTTCHDPHASDFRAILSQDPRTLCVTCHNMGEELSRDQVHSPVEGFFCTDCHDPHSSRFRGILVNSQRDLCFTCHPSVARLASKGVQHQPFLYDNCTGCHEPHGSDFEPLLNEEQPGLCYDCHGEVEYDFLKVSHHPVGTISFNCSDCHDPHAADYAGLLPAENNEICYTCHRVPIQASYDASAHRTEPCWRCHTPHGSEYGPLLKQRQPLVCFSCHTRPDYDDKVGGYPNHPVRPVFYDANSDASLTCTTSCHDPHGTRRNFMLQYYNFPLDGNCLLCHGIVPGTRVGVDY